MPAREGDRVVSVGRWLGGTSGYVIRTRWAVCRWALVEVDGGWFLNGKRIWMVNYALAVIERPGS